MTIPPGPSPEREGHQAPISRCGGVSPAGDKGLSSRWASYMGGDNGEVDSLHVRFVEGSDGPRRVIEQFSD